MFNFLGRRLASSKRIIFLFDSNTQSGMSISLRCLSSQISSNSSGISPKAPESVPNLDKTILPKIEFLSSDRVSREDTAKVDNFTESVKKNLGLGFPANYGFALGNPTAFTYDLEKRINQKFLAASRFLPQGSIERGIRLFSSAPSSTEVPQSGAEKSKKRETFRPLSPHLLVYKPQLTSTLSIINRICAAFLTGEILLFGLYMKLGSCFTYPSAYQFFFYSPKLVPIALQMSALALAYHVLYYPYKWIYLK